MVEKGSTGMAALLWILCKNDGGIRPEVCKTIFAGTDPDLYIRRWAAEKLRDGNGITKYYMIKLHY